MANFQRTLFLKLANYCILTLWTLRQVKTLEGGIQQLFYLSSDKY